MLCKRLWTLRSRIADGAMGLIMVLGLTLVVAQAQTFSVLHNFTGGSDGANPLAGLTMDQAGSLYGTASLGGVGNGTVFKLARQGSGWILNPLYQFRGMPDGFFPEARVVFGPDGSLYGTTFYGGIAQPQCIQGGPLQCGTVFQLRPPATACKTALCPWTETQLYQFGSQSGLFWPSFGDLIFDRSGHIYGTGNQGTTHGSGYGAVFQLTASNGGWTETDIYDFHNQGDGAQPLGSVIFDTAGNLYGTTYGTPPDQLHNPWGTVYELTPSGSGWTETTLYKFQNASDGATPWTDLIIDAAGNLYGTTAFGGSGGGGTVWELSPSNGSWTFSVIYSFPGSTLGPAGPVLMDAAGNLYGTSLAGGTYQQGSVFKLTHSGGWTYTSLHDFTNGSDGRSPYGHLIFDANGNLCGTAGWGGGSGNGVVWEITP